MAILAISPASWGGPPGSFPPVIVVDALDPLERTRITNHPTPKHTTA